MKAEDGKYSFRVFRRPILTPRAFEGNVMKYLCNSRFDANSIGVQNAASNAGRHMPAVGLSHRLAAQQIAAHRVADRQRIAALAVAGLKPALEVGAPDRVGRIGGQERRRRGRTPSPRPARLRQPLFAQPIADRALGRRPPATGRRASGAASWGPRSDGAHAAPAPPPPAPRRAPAHGGSARTNETRILVA